MFEVMVDAESLRSLCQKKAVRGFLSALPTNSLLLPSEQALGDLLLRQPLELHGHVPPRAVPKPYTPEFLLEDLTNAKYL